MLYTNFNYLYSFTFSTLYMTKQRAWVNLLPNVLMSNYCCIEITRHGILNAHLLRRKRSLCVNF